MGLLLLAGGVVPGAARSEPADPEAGAPEGLAPDDDSAALLLGLHELHLVVIRLSELARAKSTNDDVRDYADRLIRDHRSFDKRVVKMAKARGLALDDLLARAPDADDRHAALEELVQAMSALDGQQFDAVYLHMMGVAHLSAIEVLDREAQFVPSAPLQRAVVSFVPVFGQHLILAHHLGERMGHPVLRPRDGV
jgi:putative membrane protein